jgi:hypothetical protein
MPLELTDAELATAATACRAMASQEGERAKKMENPTLRGPLEANVRRYAALAMKLEAARKRAFDMPFAKSQPMEADGPGKCHVCGAPTYMHLQRTQHRQ